MHLGRHNLGTMLGDVRYRLPINLGTECSNLGTRVIERIAT